MWVWDMSFKYSRLLLMLILTQAGSQGANKEVATLITARLHNVDSIRHEVVILSDTLQNRISNLTGTTFDDGIIDVFTVYRGLGIAGFGLMDAVQSKSSVLPFLVVTDSHGSIQLVELLSTPDARTAKLRSPFWKKQFIGKTKIEFRQIDALSGVTVSSRDITHGVIRVICYLQLSGKIKM